MFNSFFGFSRDEDHASGIIRYLSYKNVFGVREGFMTNEPHHTQLRLTMAVVDVKIVCRDNKIYVTLRAYSDNDYEGHLPAEVERVKAQIRSYLGGSHAAKWRHRVVGI